MKFLSDILAKAGLTVDGVVTLNNTATGQTPATNDNSTKLATTEFIKNQSYLSANQTITVSGDATGSGTTSIALTLANSGVTAGTYGNASNIPTIVVDAKGRITSISTNAVSIVTTLAGLSDVTLTSPSANQVLQYNGTQWVNGAAPTTYSLPIATSSILGGIKVGTGLSIDPTTGVLTVSGGSGGSFNFRTIQEFTATSGQSTFTISGGYVVGYVEVLINGVYLSESLYTATNGTTIVLDEAAATGDIVTVFLYSIYNFGGNIYARNVDTLTATAGQTSFTTSYIPGQIDVYYNGSKLTAAEFTATSGTAIVLGQAAVSGDIIEVVTYLAGAGLNASRTLTINGTTFDLTANRTWTLTTANISEVTNLYYTDARARAAISVTGSGSYNSTTGVITVTGGVTSVNTLTGAVVLTTTNIAEGTNLYYTDARVGTYLTTNSYATQTYVGTQIANLVASSPATLDTLNELAAALGNDPSFATTIATSIGTKVPQTRTITINGTTLDLSADRSFTIAGGVTSFNTRTGAITAASGDYTTAQVTESGNLYYTDARARLAISLSTTGTSGAATYDSATGVLNIPQYQGGVTSFNTRTGAITLSSLDVTTALTYTPVTNARTISINGTSYDLTADRSWTIAPDVSVRNTYAFTATAAQTTFTVTGGYSVGLVDVFINGVKLAAADFTATNGTTVVLGTGTGVGNIVEIVKYVSAFTTAQEALNGTGLVRMSGTTVTYDNATYATQSYVTTAVANLVNSAPSTLDTLNELATALGNDANFATTITTSIATKQPQLSGTGFVKISGTTISYDNSTYLTTSSASTTYLPLAGGTLTGPLNGTTANFSGIIAADNADIYSQNGTGSNLSIGFKQSSAVKFRLRYDIATDIVAMVGSSGNFIQYWNQAGNLGLGVTPSAWDSAQTRVLELGTIGNYFAGYSGSSVLYIGTNSYLASDGWKYARTGFVASQIDMGGGQFRFLNAVSGTAGAAITWVAPLTIASTGAATFSAGISAASFSTGGNIELTTTTAGYYIYNSKPALRYSYFGYSSGYHGILVGATSGNQSLFFSVDVSANPSGAFSGLGSEYVWRNAGSFITPNSINNGYNTLFTWNSSGQLNITGATTVGSLTSNGNVTGTQFNAFNDRNYLARGGFRITSATNNASTLDISVTDSTTSIYSNYYSSGNDNTIIIGTYANLSNQLVLKSSGNIGFSTTSPDSYLAAKLVVFTTAQNDGITIATNNSTYSNNLFFARGTSGSDRTRGAISYNHSTDTMTFVTNDLAKISITNTGTLFQKGYVGGTLLGGFSVIGTLSAVNVGDRYLHVKINTIGSMMYWIKIFGYVYTTNIVEGMGGGYIGGGTGGVNQAFQNGNIVAQYQNNGFLEIVVDTLNASTTNRWGSITFLGGTDAIANVQPLEILTFSWTASTTRVY